MFHFHINRESSCDISNISMGYFDNMYPNSFVIPVCSDFIEYNQCITVKLLSHEFRYHKLHLLISFIDTSIR